jgi:hypothetical protein
MVKDARNANALLPARTRIPERSLDRVAADPARYLAHLKARSLDRAGRELAAAQGPNPSRWRASATRERITFVPGLLPYTMRYTNRPSGIQQIVSFSGAARSGS